MVVVRWVLLGLLGVLAILGGIRLTSFVRFAWCETRAERVARKCKPCTCGHDGIAVHTTQTGKAVAIQCLHCYRFVADGDLIERWNAGEEDEGESDDGDE